MAELFLRDFKPANFKFRASGCCCLSKRAGARELAIWFQAIGDARWRERSRVGATVADIMIPAGCI